MRADGRQNGDIRPMKARLGELDRADGSGRFEFGESACVRARLGCCADLVLSCNSVIASFSPLPSSNSLPTLLGHIRCSTLLPHTGLTAALASFTGPIEVRLREERVDRATLEVVHRPLDGIGATPSRAIEDALRGAFEPLLSLHRFPRALVQLVVQNLTPSAAATSTRNENEWSEEKQVSWPASSAPSSSSEKAPIGPSGGMVSRAAAFNAASLAALHAGSVGMRAVPLAVAVALVDGEFVVDPTGEEEAEAEARFGFAWAFGAGVAAAADRMDEEDEEAEIVWTEAEGAFTRQQVSRGGSGRADISMMRRVRPDCAGHGMCLRSCRASLRLSSRSGNEADRDGRV